MPFLKGAGIFASHLPEQLIEIRKTPDPHRVAYLGHAPVLQQQGLSLADPVLIHEIRERHPRLPLEITAKSGSAQMHLCGNLVDIRRLVVTPMDILVYRGHPDLVIEKGLYARVDLIQPLRLRFARQPPEDAQQGDQLLEMIQPLQRLQLIAHLGPAAFAKSQPKRGTGKQIFDLPELRRMTEGIAEKILLELNHYLPVGCL